MANGLSSWNPKVSCTPVLCNREQIVGNQTGPLAEPQSRQRLQSRDNLPLRPDNTKRWLTASSSTPSGWVSPGPPCHFYQREGQVVSAFVQVNGVQRTTALRRIGNSTFQPINGGSPISQRSTIRRTFNTLLLGTLIATPLTRQAHAYPSHKIDRD